MPLIGSSGYKRRPWYLCSRHLETIIPSLLNKAEEVAYDRERLELADGDFLDLDWIKGGHQRLLVIGHGLEGSSNRHYIRRPASYFSKRDWDILAWNNRGCGGEMNRLARSYHHGETQDLRSVLDHVLENHPYTQIVLLGISMAGCQTVKYFGEYEIDERVLGGVSVSVSWELKDTTVAAEQNLFGLYGKIFLKKIKRALEAKAEKHAELKEIDLSSVTDFDSLHEKVTLKLTEFNTVEQFYKDSSCGNYADNIKKPVLVINAKNDPLLGPNCFPYDVAEGHEYVHLETPRHGGHVGFSIAGKSHSYIEERTEQFIEEVILPPSRTSVKQS